jgi:hypothetical protein
MVLARGFGGKLYLCGRKVERHEICIPYKMWQQCKILQQEIPLSQKNEINVHILNCSETNIDSVLRYEANTTFRNLLFHRKTKTTTSTSTFGTFNNQPHLTACRCCSGNRNWFAKCHIRHL